MRKALARIAVLMAWLLISAGLRTPALASEVEPSLSCALTVTAPDVGAGELDDLQFPVALYRVAAIGEDGRLVATDEYAELGDAIATAQESGLATDWEEAAEQARELVEKDALEPAATLTMRGGTARQTKLQTGLYLLLVDDVAGAAGTYSFEASLVCLPQNLYLSSPGAVRAADVWDYDAEVELKASYTPNEQPIPDESEPSEQSDPGEPDPDEPEPDAPEPDVPAEPEPSAPTGATPATGDASVSVGAVIAGGLLCIACAAALAVRLLWASIPRPARSQESK